MIEGLTIMFRLESIRKRQFAIDTENN